MEERGFDTGRGRSGEHGFDTEGGSGEGGDRASARPQTPYTRAGHETCKISYTDHV